MGQVTSLLAAARMGQRDALGALYEVLYPELLRLAHSRMRRSGALTLLDTTSLVHESFMRMQHAGTVLVGDKGSFMAYAARVMRSVVVDLVRSRQTRQRGADAVHEAFDPVDEVHLAAPMPASDAEVLRIHDALRELADIDERLAQIVEMRYFAGMTERETADALGVAVRTVARDWQKARLFLQLALR